VARDGATLGFAYAPNSLAGDDLEEGFDVGSPINLFRSYLSLIHLSIAEPSAGFGRG